MLHDDAYHDACTLLDASTTEECLAKVIHVLIESYGLKHFVYHAVRLPGVSRSHPKLLLSYPDAWVERYTERNYFGIDPVVAAGAVAVLPVDWARLDRRGLHARRIFGEAGEAGIGRQGLTFPVRGPFGDHALFTVTGDEDATEWERRRRLYMRDFQMIAHLVHGRMLALSGGADIPPTNVLSPRERECLQWAARGKTNKAIARELKISERVVRAYFETARHKLHCLNRSHVVSRALSLRLIDPDIPQTPSLPTDCSAWTSHHTAPRDPPTGDGDDHGSRYL